MEPRETGYRGIHLIYAYQSESKPDCNGLKIEIQLRSRQQHAWATAVEIVDTFTAQGIKDGNGDPKWQRFFALMGTFIAEKENLNPVPNTPTNTNELRSEIASLTKELTLLEHLDSYRATLHLDKNSIPNAEFYLLQLDAENGQSYITGFKKDQIAQAQETYLAMEKALLNQPKQDVVLVSVGSIESLKRAYPNYFADTEVFSGIVREAIKPFPAIDISDVDAGS